MTTTTFTDAELLAQARQGDETAFAELYVRHEAAARRLARAYGRAGDPDDLVNEAFERVLKALRKGVGPTEAFRAYLFVTLRRLAAERIVRSQDDPYDEVPEPVRAAAHDDDLGLGTGLDPGERSLVVRAFESLADRWQTVLWHTAVEGRTPRDLAVPLGMSPNAAAALAYRAREKLRQAYLQAHLQTAPRPQCEPHRSRLGAYVRDGLGTRDRGATEAHLDECGSCRGLVAELADVNRLLVRSLVPVFVRAGEVAAALAASTTAAAAAAGAGATVGAGVGGALRGAGELGRRTWSKARSNPAATSAVVGALLVLAVVAGALIASREEVELPATPDEQAAPTPGAPPPDDDPAPEVPLEVAPPRVAEPIVSSGTAPPGPSLPPAATDPGLPLPTPTSPRAPRVPTTRSEPPTPTTWPDAPPSSAAPGTSPPATTTTPPAPAAAPLAPPAADDPPCLIYVQIGGLLDARLCLDLPLLGGAGASDSPGSTPEGAG